MNIHTALNKILALRIKAIRAYHLHSPDFIRLRRKLARKKIELVKMINKKNICVIFDRYEIKPKEKP